MDPDSFLNLMSPDLHQLDDWCPSPQLHPHENSVDPLNIAPYRSVLMLSDIASALPSFRKSASIAPGSADSAQSVADHPDVAATSRYDGPICMTSRYPAQLQQTADQTRNVMDVHDQDELDVKPLRLACSHDDQLNIIRSSWPPNKCPKLSETSSRHRHKLYPPAQLPQRVKQASRSKETLSQREAHIRCERQRRRSMTDSFTTLQSLIPKLKLRHADRITVLTEVITYIQSLRHTLEELERKKSDVMAHLGLFDDYGPTKQNVKNGDSSMDCCRSEIMSGDDPVSMVEVTVRLSGADVIITLNTPRKKGVWSGVLLLLQSYSVEVVNATLATSGENNFHCIHGKVSSISKFKRDDLQCKLQQLIVKQFRRRKMETLPMLTRKINGSL